MSVGISRVGLMARPRMRFLRARHPVLFCDFIKVSGKYIEVVFNLVAFEGKKMYVSVGPRVSAHNLSCFVV
jgi:hypothetical protein